MKYVPFIPPLMAAMTVGVLLWHQRSETQSIRDQYAVLVSTVTQAESKGMKSATQRAEATAKSQAAHGAGSDFVKKLELADFLAAMNEPNGMPDMRAMLKIQAAMENMTVPEIQAILAEATAANLTENQKNQVCNQLLSALGKKDPKLALEEGQKLSEKGTEGNLYQLRGVFENWARTDPAMAMAWLDGQIAAGKMENTSLSGSNQKRVGFETALIAMQLTKDPVLAEARFQQLSIVDRNAVLQNTWNFPTSDEGQQGYVKLVRSGELGEDGQRSLLSNYAASISRKGELTDVTAFLLTSKASPGETTSIVQECASQQLREKIAKDPKNLTSENSTEKTTEWRNWVMQSDPEHAASIIGKSLIGLPLKHSLQEAVAAVSPPGQLDAVKQAMIENGSPHKEGLRELADSIADESVRAQIIEKKWPKLESNQPPK